MIHIIPSVKELREENGFLKNKEIFCNSRICDSRLILALSKFRQDDNGTKLEIDIDGDEGEGYRLWIKEQEIKIQADSPAGAFYGIQTLRQLLEHDDVPCLYIKDEPDFPYRGFYHDVSRGKIPTVETIKHLIDQMAYYKLNSLQLYVEHTFEFEEYKKLNEKMGYLTAQEMEEIDAYCQENFIEFIPSVSTFGHLYELLEQEQYQHLRVLKDYRKSHNFWHERMQHHTIDPLNPESIEIIKSLIDQYVPHFKSEIFNICCDETFDLLKICEDKGLDSGKLYVDFVKQIIRHVQQKDKKVMMWADILLRHPEMIEEVPADTYFLNWNYRANPPEDRIIRLAELGRKQIVCPGVSNWNRLCENVAVEEQNICLMAEYGYKHGAIGMLNTSWGDWGNPCSLELSMYGMVLGAAKSWSVATAVDDKFYSSVDFLLYEQENGMQYLRELSDMHEQVKWADMCKNYFRYRYGEGEELYAMQEDDLKFLQERYRKFVARLTAEAWKNDAYRIEMLLAAEGICVMAELSAKMADQNVHRVTDTKEWIKKYCTEWLAKNKASRLSEIEEMFLYCEDK